MKTPCVFFEVVSDNAVDGTFWKDVSRTDVNCFFDTTDHAAELVTRM